MKRSVLLIWILCCITLAVPAQNRRTGNTNSSTRRTTTAPNRTAPAPAQKVEPPVIPAGLYSAQELENLRLATLKEIELTSFLLNETNASSKTLLNRLNLLTQQILSRKKVISILEQEIAEIDRNIKTMSDDVELLNRDLEKTKENYAKSMQNQRQEYRTAQHKVLLILSAENLSQSYRRMRYLREYADWQKKEAERIGDKQTEIVHRLTQLEESRKEKQDLLTQRENENRKMVSEEQQQKKEVRDINNKQKDLQRLIDQKRKEADALNSQIERLIAEDIKNSEKNRPVTAAETKLTEKVLPETATAETVTAEATTAGTTTSGTATSGTASPESKTSETASTDAASTVAASSSVAAPGNASTATAAKSTAPNTGYVLLESEAVLSKEFANNKGKLPFPLTGKYTVISDFGEHQHQQLTHVRTNNNGIDIQTTAGAEACAVFKGVVTRVFVMPGYNNNVIIRHGDYLTVYSNLSNVYIKAGDTVTARQVIGKIFTDTEKGNETILHFQLWNERTKLNPSAWVKQ